KIFANGLCEVAAKSARGVGVDLISRSIGVRKFYRGRQVYAGQSSRPSRNARAGGEIFSAVPRLAGGKVVGRAINERALLNVFQNFSKLFLLAPNFRLGTADEVDELIEIAADVGAMQVNRQTQFALRPLRH